MHHHRFTTTQHNSSKQQNHPRFLNSIIYTFNNAIHNLSTRRHLGFRLHRSSIASPSAPGNPTRLAGHCRLRWNTLRPSWLYAKHEWKSFLSNALTPTSSIPLGNHQSQRHRPQHPQLGQRPQRKPRHRVSQLRHRTFTSPPDVRPQLIQKQELRGQVLHKRREPARAHMALRCWHLWLLGDDCASGVRRNILLRGLYSQVHACRGFH
jgi:hypothetical protein